MKQAEHHQGQRHQRTEHQMLAAESAAELENIGDIQQREQPEPGAGRDGEKDDGKSGCIFTPVYSLFVIARSEGSWRSRHCRLRGLSGLLSRCSQ
jgi:hypothetical protein